MDKLATMDEEELADKVVLKKVALVLVELRAVVELMGEVVAMDEEELADGAISKEETSAFVELLTASELVDEVASTAEEGLIMLFENAVEVGKSFSTVEEEPILLVEDAMEVEKSFSTVEDRVDVSALVEAVDAPVDVPVCEVFEVAAVEAGILSTITSGFM